MLPRRRAGRAPAFDPEVDPAWKAAPATQVPRTVSTGQAAGVMTSPPEERIRESVRGAVRTFLGAYRP